MLGIDLQGQAEPTSTTAWRTRSLRRAARAFRDGRSERRAERDLERRLRRQLRELDIRPPLTIAALCRAVERKRQRPILLRPCPMPVPGPQGLWVETPHADLILYQEHTSFMHQRHIILHEVMGHICGEHKGELSPVSLGMFQPGTVQRVMARCTYDTAQECEAERAATIVTAWACVLDEVAPASSPHPELRRVHSALGDRHGWWA
ncbi:hypothetical protein ACIG3E_33565 [Streptomyces sp. NPDC053474]|uniref:hypothetical protein n=1 Tax=Streptomyces sp. NPDC053474 TaxID=3365704 RepID=UPI0037D05B66